MIPGYSDIMQRREIVEIKKIPIHIEQIKLHVTFEDI